MNILLVGHPNVGKSVIFSQLTGVNVIASNYPGTTVGFTEGEMRFGEQTAKVIDVPGTYSLSAPSSMAEEIAAKMLAEGDLIINVIDATRLERNLHLTLELLEHRKPMVVVLNMWDDAQHKGILIDVQKLQNLLGVPVIPTVAITGEGLKTLQESLSGAVVPVHAPATDEQRWVEIGHITESVQSLHHRHHTFWELFGDCCVRRSSGIPIAIIVLLTSFFCIRFIGESITKWLTEPAFEYLWKPFVKKLSAVLGGGGFVHHVLIGKLIDGDIDFVQSFGLLTTGLFVPLGMVFPFVFAFYLWLGILEDVGYLPRLSVLLDRLMHKLGLHGWAIIPNLLGLGCNVPAILATRILEDRRERLIACTLVSIALPCAALQAMIWALVGDPARGGGIGHVLIVYGVLFAAWLLIGLVLAKILPGTSPDLLMEIPPYRMPYWPIVLKNLRLRITGFLREAIPIVLLGVLVVNILYWLKIFDTLAMLSAPIMTKLLGLPKEAIIALAVGFLRKDMAMGLLATMNLTIKQLVVAGTVLAMFFPCIATFIVLIREIGWRGMAFSVAVMIVFSLLAGGILNAIL